MDKPSVVDKFVDQNLFVHSEKRTLQRIYGYFTNVRLKQRSEFDQR